MLILLGAMRRMSFFHWNCKFLHNLLLVMDHLKLATYLQFLAGLDSFITLICTQNVLCLHTKSNCSGRVAL